MNSANNPFSQFDAEWIRLKSKEKDLVEKGRALGLDINPLPDIRPDETTTQYLQRIAEFVQAEQERNALPEPENETPTTSMWDF